jgi:hypothetical protein
MAEGVGFGELLLIFCSKLALFPEYSSELCSYLHLPVHYKKGTVLGTAIQSRARVSIPAQALYSSGVFSIFELQKWIFANRTATLPPFSVESGIARCCLSQFISAAHFMPLCDQPMELGALRMLTIVDEYTRERHALRVVPAQRPSDVLEWLLAVNRLNLPIYPSAVILRNATSSVFHQRHIGRVLRSS